MSKVKIVYGNAEILEVHYLEATRFIILTHGDRADTFELIS